MSKSPAIDQQELIAVLNEKCVLGSILLENNLIHEATELLSCDDFTMQSHRVIYGAMVGLYEASEPIDYISIVNQLKAQGITVESVGGVISIAALTDGVPRTDSLAYYAKQIKRRSMIRGIARAATAIVEMCIDETESPTIIEDAQRIFWNACDAHLPSGMIPLGDAAMKYLARVEGLEENTGDLAGIATGFKELDYRLLGLQRTDLIVIAARPSVGKTTLAFNIAINAARAGHKVGFFSIEMKDERIGEKGVSLVARLDSARLRLGRLDRETWQVIYDAAHQLSDLPFRVCDQPGMGAMDIRTKAQRMKREMGLDLIVVDYLQLMKRDPKIHNLYEGIGENVNCIKEIAKELDVPVLLLSQLNREVESRGVGAEPQFSDLGGSGEIERTADAIVFLYNAQSIGRTVSAKLAKNRTGETGLFTLHYDRPINFFGDIER